jgi:Mrp family chromosome partitioning ATPase
MSGDPGFLEREQSADAIDTARYGAALRRSAGLMAAIVLLITGGVVAASLAAPETYTARTDVVLLERDALPAGGGDAESVRRRLATMRALATAPAVLAPAAARLGTQAVALEDRVTAEADAQAALLSITATGDSGVAAQRAANAVARAFVAQQARAERSRLRAVIDRVSRRLEELRASGGRDEGTIAVLEERRAELLVTEAVVGADLLVARAADAPDAPTAPRPLRNAILALFASLFLAMLVALAHDHLRPRPSPRELAQLLGAPILATLPARRRLGGAAGSDTAYRTLAALLRMALRRGGARSVLVTSAAPAEGRTTVAAGLAAALARAGTRTLLVSGDLRHPELDARWLGARRRGLWDLLVAGEKRASTLAEIVVAGDGDADLLPAGTAAGEPGDVLEPQAVRAVLDAAAELGYAYVVVDAPPMTGDVPDAALLAAACDRVLVVVRPDRISPTVAADLRDRLDQIGARPVGLAVVARGGGVTGAGRAPAPAVAAEEPSGTPVGR